MAHKRAADGGRRRRFDIGSGTDRPGNGPDEPGRAARRDRPGGAGRVMNEGDRDFIEQRRAWRLG